MERGQGGAGTGGAGTVERGQTKHIPGACLNLAYLSSVLPRPVPPRPSDLATRALPEPGFWLGSHISNLPSFQRAVVFIGSGSFWGVPEQVPETAWSGPLISG